jgi:hypothetical protein
MRGGGVRLGGRLSHVVQGETGVAPAPRVVPEADAMVPLPSKAHRHPPGDGWSRVGHGRTGSSVCSGGPVYRPAGSQAAWWRPSLRGPAVRPQIRPMA